VLLALSSAHAQRWQRLPRSPLDPPKIRNLDPPVQLTPPPHHPSRKSLYTAELQGFAVGNPHHEKSIVFCQKIAAIVASTVPRQKQILIVVTGTADGLHNSGLRIPLSYLPIECQRAVRLPIDDPDLALLRACSVRHQLGQLLNASRTPILFHEKTADEPDGGKSGPEYRFVRVELQEAKGAHGR
jgi:hypothetical protein